VSWTSLILPFIKLIIGGLKSLLTQTPTDAINNPDRIDRPELSQPLCTVLQIALIDLIRSFGITPKAVVGHSSGEIAAGYAVGALSHKSACKVAYFRGLYAGKLVDMMADAGSPGAMMSVNLTPEQVPAYLEELGLEGSQVGIACFNSPGNLTLSGQVGALELLKKHLDQKGVFAHLVNTGVAYHSPAVLAVADELQAAAMKSSLKPDYTHNRDAQRIPMFSTVTGREISLKLVETPEYWVTNLTSPVRFVDALQRMLSATDAAVTDLIEIGPHAALKRPIKDSTPETMRYFSVLERKQSPLRTTLTLLGSLFCHGHPVNVLAGNGQCPDQGSGSMPFLVDCPPYPFDLSNTYWHESRLSKGYRFRSSSPGYLIGRRANDWNPLQPRWRNWLCTETNPWLGHHRASSYLAPD
jgi:acyl transferase domain-containing protein